MDKIRFNIRQINGILRGYVILEGEEAENYRNSNPIDQGLYRVKINEAAEKQYKTSCYVTECQSPEYIGEDEVKESKKRLRKMKKGYEAVKKAEDNYFIQWIKSELDLDFVQELKFHPVRKWRFDYACERYKIAIEVEGGVFTQGRHSRGAGMVNDMEKYNTAVVNGWILLRVIPRELMTTKTLKYIEQARNLSKLILEGKVTVKMS